MDLSDSSDSNVQGTSLSQVDARDEDATVDSKEVIGDAHEDKETDFYRKPVSAFASDITTAARNALLTRRGHTRVVAVIAYWMNAKDLAQLRTDADELGKLFRNEFNFEVLIYKIPDTVRSYEFISTIGQELDKVVNDRDSLFILYYGGHASIWNPTGERYWRLSETYGKPDVKWSTAIEMLFCTNVVCSKLFIFDCSHAGAMIKSTIKWRTSCEILGACDADVRASAKTSSFTKAVVKEISNTTYNVWELHGALCSIAMKKQYSLKNYPYYRNFVSRPSVARWALLKKVRPLEEYEDRPQEPPDILARMRNMSDAAMCISITFKCDAEAFVENFDKISRDWKRWFTFAPSKYDSIIVEACKGPKLLDASDTLNESCFTIWTFPVWLWNVMPPLNDYQNIGVVGPQNFALATTSIETSPAATKCSSCGLSSGSSGMTVREAIVSRRLSEPGKFLLIPDTSVEGTTEEYDPLIGSNSTPLGPTIAGAQKLTHQPRGRRNSC